MPTVFENSVVTVTLTDAVTVDLELWDTAGQEEYDKLRPFCYANADVALVAFSVDNRASLLNVQQKWIAEALKECPNIPIVLVGLKCDLRDGAVQDQAVSTEMASTAAVNLSAMYLSQSRSRHFFNRIKPLNSSMATFPYLHAIKYIECSSREGRGVDQVFEHATRAAMMYREFLTRKNNKRTCLIL